MLVYFLSERRLNRFKARLKVDLLCLLFLLDEHPIVSWRFYDLGFDPKRKKSIFRNCDNEQIPFFLYFVVISHFGSFLEQK